MTATDPELAAMLAERLVPADGRTGSVQAEMTLSASPHSRPGRSGAESRGPSSALSTGLQRSGIGPGSGAGATVNARRRRKSKSGRLHAGNDYRLCVIGMQIMTSHDTWQGVLPGPHDKT